MRECWLCVKEDKWWWERLLVKQYQISAARFFIYSTSVCMLLLATLNSVKYLLWKKYKWASPSNWPQFGARWLCNNKQHIHIWFHTHTKSGSKKQEETRGCPRFYNCAVNTFTHSSQVKEFGNTCCSILI